MDNEIPDRRNEEFISQREHQFPADPRELSGDQLADAIATRDFHGTPAGEPNQKYDVRSTFDSRPVNGFDFNSEASLSEINSTDNGGVFVIDVFTVPEGYVALPKLWYHYLEPLPVLNGRAGVRVTLLLDGVEVNYNKLIPVGAESDGLVRSFYVADEFQTIGIKFTIDQAIPIFAIARLSARVYGNLLLKHNIPAQFEVANPCGGCGSGVNIAPASLDPVLPKPMAQPQTFVPPPTPATPPPAPVGRTFNFAPLQNNRSPVPGAPRRLGGLFGPRK